MAFIGDIPPGQLWIPIDDYFFNMPSALYIVCTEHGFVVAADGRRRKGEGENAELLNDDEIKIFKITDPGRCLAYAAVGTVGLAKRDSTDDPNVVVFLPSEIESAAIELSSKRFVEPSLYVRNLCRPVYNKILKAKKDGLIDYPENPVTEGFDEPGMTIARLLVFGYYEGTSVCFIIRFFHREQELGALEPYPMLLKWGDEIGHGSQKVWNCLQTDEDFRQYRPNRPKRRENITINQAADVARKHILACCDPKAREIDPMVCNGIGGYVHIAEISQTGFKWIVPPTQMSACH